MREDALQQILTARKKTVETAKRKMSIDELDRQVKTTAPALDFKAALMRTPGTMGLIAEMKKKSPSAGLLRPDYRVADIAAAYKAGGADALSVLTELDFFGGEIEDMQRAKAASGLPVLRKDFIFDFYQVAEAKAAGADAILLIADMLDSYHLEELAECARDYKLQTLVEVFSGSVLESALRTESKLIGINTRNLRTLEMIPDNVVRLARQIPSDRVIVAESGIRNPADLQKLKAIPVHAILVGEALLKQNDLEKAVRTLKEAS